MSHELHMKLVAHFWEIVVSCVKNQRDFRIMCSNFVSCVNKPARFSYHVFKFRIMCSKYWEIFASCVQISYHVWKTLRGFRIMYYSIFVRNTERFLTHDTNESLHTHEWVFGGILLLANNDNMVDYLAGHALFCNTLQHTLMAGSFVDRRIAW